MKVYTFFNQGTTSFFRPEKRVTLNSKPVSNLELHIDLVNQAQRRDVYILDHKGREVKA